MGEQVREGSWSPLLDPVPKDILDVVAYADSKGVRLLAYVYPCLAFQAVPDALIGGSANLANQDYQDWLLETLLAFMKVTGAGGFAWDHNIFAGGPDLQYAQWRAWMRILKELRLRHPDMVMDHRQTAHMWGPWYQLAGSYLEPIAGGACGRLDGRRRHRVHNSHGIFARPCGPSAAAACLTADRRPCRTQMRTQRRMACQSHRYTPTMWPPTMHALSTAGTLSVSSSPQRESLGLSSTRQSARQTMEHTLASKMQGRRGRLRATTTTSVILTTWVTSG